MENKLKAYVNDLFKELKQTESLQETKEELILNLTEKYNDLIQEGLSNEQAYKKVIASIGDVDELIAVETHNPKVEQKVEVNIINTRKMYPKVFQAIAVSLFILSPIPVIVLGSMSDRLAVFGIVALFGMVAIGVALLIIAGGAKDDTKVEDDEADDDLDNIHLFTSRDKRKIKNINGLIYLIAAILFFSNILSGWGIGWTIFIAAYGVTQLLTLYLYYNRVRDLEKAGAQTSPKQVQKEVFKLASSTIWTIAVLLFFSNLGGYSISWVVFLIAAAGVQILKIVLDMEAH
ncbi:hypothetical protein AOC36_07460 [Erysipelothrix larvae]|uniref:Beta-carotene 15,15'-monooxygenase n=1 Tax=Erysipelothrix larvae TaxID=1514105 RepID=A0A120JTT0_9FIRM|nr:permease prefix domain 1-containing protein [Erysipelothrix larvae]AMC93826.1 hypothetical protein AOC36_07460 [Erysipelothrix larvae]